MTPTPLSPGQILDGYVVEVQLGFGATANVYQAHRVTTGQVVALKQLAVTNPGIRKRMHREGRLLARIDHPNVVRCLDAIDDTEHGMILVLEHVDGPTLEQVLSDQFLSVSQVDVLVRSLVAGVGAAHERGVVHRDLKPGNILLQPVREGRWQVRIADFGLARWVDVHGETQAGTAIGTPGYMAPEQWSDSRFADVRSDIFSLGCILFEMLTDHQAFPATTISEARELVERGARPEFPRHYAKVVPARMIEATLACLEVDPGRRPSSCVDLLGRWTGEPVTDPDRTLRPDELDTLKEG